MGTIKGLLIVAIVLLVFLCLQSINKINKKTNKLFNAAKESVRRLIFGLVFYTLRAVLPRDKNLVLFTADEGKGFSGNPKYLFLEAQKYKQLHPVWITKNPDVYKAVAKEGYEVCMLNSREGLKLQMRAGTLIHTNSIKEEFIYWAVGGATSINTWHGVGLKRSWFRNKNSFSGKWMYAPPSLRRSWHMWWACTNMTRENYVIGTSEEVDDYYPETYHVPMDHVLMLGQARNDVFFDDSLEEGRLPEAFKNGKVILYMPTHRDYGERKGKKESVGQDINYRKISAIMEKYGYTFVIKQHRFNTNAGMKNSRYPHIVDISKSNYDLDPQLLLKYTDILITDYSSCYTDYLLLDRPVIFYCYDLDEYLDKWDLNFDYDYVTPGPKTFDSDELIAELEKLLKGQDEYEAERQRVKRVFYAPENQGPVAQKQMEYIVNNIINKR